MVGAVGSTSTASAPNVDVHGSFDESGLATPPLRPGEAGLLALLAAAHKPATLRVLDVRLAAIARLRKLSTQTKSLKLRMWRECRAEAFQTCRLEPNLFYPFAEHWERETFAITGGDRPFLMS